MFSLQAVKSELDLFCTTPIQNSVVRGNWVPYKPIAPLRGDSAIEFCIPPSADEYTDLALTFLYAKFKITDEKGGNLADDAKISLTNNFLHSMIDQAEVHLNGSLVTPAASRYCYRAYIESLLNYSTESKKTHLTAALWAKDTAGEFDSITANEGFTKRQQYIKGSKTIDAVGGVYLDLFNINKFLLNRVEIKLRLARSKTAFALLGDVALSADKFKIEITDVSLLVRRVQLNPSILLAHTETLLKKPATYPFTRTEIKTQVIQSGLNNTTLENIYIGTMPERVIIGLVSHEACSGSLRLNPYNFQHYNLNFLQLYIDSEPIPAKPLQVDFNNDQYISAYLTLFTGTNIFYKDDGMDISREEYPKGYCLLAFDLTPDLSCSESHWNSTRKGQLRLELGFSSPLVETVSCIIYSEFQSLMEIDKDRNIVIT